MTFRGAIVSDVQPCGVKRLGYLAWHAKAQKLKAKGEKQTRCKHCGLYQWPYELAQCKLRRTENPKSQSHQD